MDVGTIFHNAFVFWVVMDALGCVPLFVSTLKYFDAAHQRKIILREMIIALAIMLLFLFFGENFLETLQIKKASLQIAGGIILFILALQMVFSKPLVEKKGHKPRKEPLIVPLAIPAIAGPGILTMISLQAGLSSSYWEVVFSVIIAWLFSVPILLLSSYLKKLLGTNGLVAIEKLFGYLIILLATKVALTGFVAAFMPHG